MIAPMESQVDATKIMYEWETRWKRRETRRDDAIYVCSAISLPGIELCEQYRHYFFVVHASRKWSRQKANRAVRPTCHAMRQCNKHTNNKTYCSLGLFLASCSACSSFSSISTINFSIVLFVHISCYLLIAILANHKSSNILLSWDRDGALCALLDFSFGVFALFNCSMFLSLIIAQSKRSISFDRK